MTAFLNSSSKDRARRQPPAAQGKNSRNSIALQAMQRYRDNPQVSIGRCIHKPWCCTDTSLYSVAWSSSSSSLGSRTAE
jgi:hypothetical protein